MPTADDLETMDLLSKIKEAIPKKKGAKEFDESLHLDPGPVAMLRPASTGQLRKQVEPLPNMQSEAVLHPTQGQPGQQHPISEPRHGGEDAEGAPGSDGRRTPDLGHLPGHAGEDQCRGKLLHKIHLAKSVSKKAASSTTTSGMNSKSKERPVQKAESSHSWEKMSTTSEPPREVEYRATTILADLDQHLTEEEKLELLNTLTMRKIQQSEDNPNAEPMA